MEGKPASDPALRNLERTIRFEFEKLILIVTIICLLTITILSGIWASR